MPTRMDPLALVVAAKQRHYAYKPLGGSSTPILGEDYTPSYQEGRNPIDNPVGDAGLRAQGGEPSNATALAARYKPHSPLNPVEPTANGVPLPHFAEGGEVLTKVSKMLADAIAKNVPKEAVKQAPNVLAQKIRAGFVDPKDLNHLMYTDPSATKLINAYQTSVDNGNVTSELRDALANKLDSMGTTPPPQVQQFAPPAPKPVQAGPVQPNTQLNSPMMQQMINPEPSGMAGGGSISKRLAELLERSQDTLRDFRQGTLPINKADIAPGDQTEIARWMNMGDWPYIENMDFRKGSKDPSVQTFDRLTNSYGLQSPTVLFRGLGDRSPDLKSMKSRYQSFTADPSLAQEYYSSSMDDKPGLIAVMDASKGMPGLPLRLEDPGIGDFGNQDEMLIPRGLSWSKEGTPQNIKGKNYQLVVPSKYNPNSNPLRPADKPWSLQEALERGYNDDDRESFAEGGSTSPSSLKWLADMARKAGIPSMAEDRARITTGIAKQAYGLDENGNPVLGGRAWTSSQHGTPPRILDELTALPNSIIPLVNLLSGGDSEPADIKAQPGHSAGFPIPKWSSDAASRLDKLDQRVKSVTGVGDAQTLPEHIEDAAGMLATPLPASKVAKEAPMLQRALEYLTPVRPPTLGRYSTDATAMGGLNSGIDEISKRLAARHASTGEVDPQFEDAAIADTNQGYAGGGSTRRDLLKKLAGLGATLSAGPVIKSLVKDTPEEVKSGALAQVAPKPGATQMVKKPPDPSMTYDRLSRIKSNVFGASDEPNWEAAMRNLALIPGSEKSQAKLAALKDFPGIKDDDINELEYHQMVNDFEHSLDELSAQHGVPFSPHPESDKTLQGRDVEQWGTTTPVLDEIAASYEHDPTIHPKLINFRDQVAKHLANTGHSETGLISKWFQEPDNPDHPFSSLLTPDIQDHIMEELEGMQ